MINWKITSHESANYLQIIVEAVFMCAISEKAAELDVLLDWCILEEDVEDLRAADVNSALKAKSTLW